MIKKSSKIVVNNILKIVAHTTMGIIFVAGLLLSYGTRSHDQTVADGIDDLGTVQITISEVHLGATAVILKAKEYSPAFIVAYIFVPKSYIVPSKKDISEFLPVGTKVNLTVKKEAVADLNAYSNLPVYKLTLENGKIIFDGSQAALSYSKHFLKKFECVFQCMIIVSFIYFTTFFVFRRYIQQVMRK